VKSLLENIPLSQIHIGDRFRKDYGNLGQFKHSIKTNGLITPIAVGLTGVLKMEGLDTSKPYTLLAGGRRTQAALDLGWTTIPAKVYDYPITELDLRSIELAENLERKDMTPVEEIQLKKAIHELQETIHGKKYGKVPGGSGWSQADTAALLKETPANLSRDLQLAKAMDQYPELGLDKCKTKSDAMKLLKSVSNKMAISAASENFQKRASKSDRIQRMIDSYIVGDCLATMATIPDNSVHLVEIDPPYAMDLHNKKSDSVMMGYNEIEAAKYLPFMANVFQQSYRILREGGWLLCWFAMDPWFQQLADLLYKSNFKFNMLPALWCKPNGQTMQPETTLANTYEPFFYCRKGNAKLSKMGRPNVFNFNPLTPSKKYHPTQRPIELMEEVLATFTRPDQTVYVPFLGSGTTLIAAERVQCKGFGNDLTQEYKDGYVVNLKETYPTEV